MSEPGSSEFAPPPNRRPFQLAIKYEVTLMDIARCGCQRQDTWRRLVDTQGLEKVPFGQSDTS